MSSQPERPPVSEAEIAANKALYNSLHVSDMSDKEGWEAVALRYAEATQPDNPRLFDECLEAAVVEYIEEATRTRGTDEGNAVNRNVLFNRCLDNAIITYLRRLKGEDSAEESLRQKWRKSLPPLTTRQNVRLYISAVTHGVNTGLITGSEARIMLYSAQLALSSIRDRTRAKRPVGRPRKDTPND